LVFVDVHLFSPYKAVDLKPVFEYLLACLSCTETLSRKESLEVRVFNRP
jgi:hypothetical protein